MDSAMNEEQALAEIVQTLTVDHGCHAVILYGSRARGNFQPTSDWDVAGIRETGATAPQRVARAFHGAWLDAFVYAEAAFTVIDPDLLRFLPARILVDERGFAKTLIERVDALDQKGPPLLPEGEDEMVRVWYQKMLMRIARGDLESKYRRVELLFQALENYFKLSLVLGRLGNRVAQVLRDQRRSEARRIVSGHHQAGEPVPAGLITGSPLMISSARFGAMPDLSSAINVSAIAATWIASNALAASFIVKPWPCGPT
jgi:hypothetical protein